MLKRIRIDSNGRVINADRRVHVTGAGPAIPAQPGNGAEPGGPDQVRWLSTGGGPWTITFNSVAGSPFQAPGNITVPGGPPGVVSQTQPPGTYKYSVLDASGNVRDDPDVIIE